VLTDRACAGRDDSRPALARRRAYLVFDEPEEIPDLVSDWCRRRAPTTSPPSPNGRQAAQAYDALACMRGFFAGLGSTLTPHRRAHASK
jgi:hypothetical protein